MEWNKMVKVFCPTTGQEEWGNGAKGGQPPYPLRCTKCGQKHGSLKK